MGANHSSLQNTHYETLGITRGASPREVKEAYYRLVRQAHPDKLSTSPIKERLEAEERTKMLNEAYEVMSDPEVRAVYDRTILTRSYAAAFSAKTSEGSREKAEKSEAETRQTPKQPQTPKREARGGDVDWNFPGVVPHPSDYTYMAEDFQRNEPWKPKDAGLRDQAKTPPCSPHPASPTSSPCSPTPETPDLDIDSDDSELASDSDDSLAYDEDPDAPMYEGLSLDDWIGLEDVSWDQPAGWKPVVYSVKNVVSPYVYMRCDGGLRYGKGEGDGCSVDD